jgi:hypothetical protein
MLHAKPGMYLPRTDGTYEVFCEQSNRLTRPCNERARFDNAGVLLSGIVTHFDTMLKPRYFCSRKCLASYLRANA